MDKRFCIGNITPEEWIKERGEWLHDHGYHRGYYHQAEEDLARFCGVGEFGKWIVNISKIVKQCGDMDPQFISAHITATVLEEVCHAYGNERHKTKDQKQHWSRLFLDLATIYSEYVF